MPRRDGSPTAEEIARQQQAGRGAAPPPAEAASPAAAAAAALLLASVASGAGVPGAPAVAQTAAGAAAVAGAAGVLAAFDRVMAERQAVATDRFVEAVRVEAPDLVDEARARLAAEEVMREREFTAKARARLDRDVRAALTLDDPAERRRELDRVIAREQRWVALREQAIEERARGAVRAGEVEAASPGGAFWRMSPRMEHCAECLRMAGKVWPWEVLRKRLPPRHLNCGCRLHTIETALRMGWVRPQDFQTADQAMVELALTESTWDPGRLEDDLVVLGLVATVASGKPVPGDLLEQANALLESPASWERPRDRRGRWRRAIRGYLERASEQREQPETRTPPAPLPGRRFTDPDAARAWAVAAFGDWERRLPSDQRDALAIYKDDEEQRYREINGALRGRREWTDRAAALAPRIEAALRRGRIPDEVVVYRAFPLSDVGGWWPLAEGVTVRERAFASTSLLREVAVSGYAAKRTDAVLAEIRLPAGAPAGFMDIIGEPTAELEVLLPAGAVFRVRSSHGVEGHDRLVRLDLIGVRADARGAQGP